MITSCILDMGSQSAEFSDAWYWSVTQLYPTHKCFRGHNLKFIFVFCKCRNYSLANFSQYERWVVIYVPSTLYYCWTEIMKQNKFFNGSSNSENFGVSTECTPKILLPSVLSLWKYPRMKEEVEYDRGSLADTLKKSEYIQDLTSKLAFSLKIHILMRAQACSVCSVVAEMRQIPTDYRVLWRKRDSLATLSRGEHPDTCLDRLLLLFWAHYIEEGPHLLCTGSL